MELFTSSRPPDTSILPKISNQIHFWSLDGPEMFKIHLNLRFSIKSAFSWRSAPRQKPWVNRRPGLGQGPRTAKLGLAYPRPGKARPGQTNIWCNLSKSLEFQPLQSPPVEFFPWLIWMLKEGTRGRVDRLEVDIIHRCKMPTPTRNLHQQNFVKFA